MRAFTVILIFLVCMGCTTTREGAVTIATRALVDRKLPLPAKHSISVSEGFCTVEVVGQSHKMWIVEFRAGDHKDPLYRVWIDQRSGTIDQSKDFKVSD